MTRTFLRSAFPDVPESDPRDTRSSSRDWVPPLVRPPHHTRFPVRPTAHVAAPAPVVHRPHRLPALHRVPPVHRPLPPAQFARQEPLQEVTQYVKKREKPKRSVKSQRPDLRKEEVSVPRQLDLFLVKKKKKK